MQFQHELSNGAAACACTQCHLQTPEQQPAGLSDKITIKQALSLSRFRITTQKAALTAALQDTCCCRISTTTLPSCDVLVCLLMQHAC
jgi:hypothetical protein